MSLAHASVSVLRTCLVQAVRGADAFALRLLQRTEYALEQSLSTGFHSARRDVLGAALHNLQQHRASVISSFPQNLLEALVLSARQPFSFSAQTLDTVNGGLLPLAAMAESASRQLKAEHKLVQMVEPQVELALADLDALMSGAQGLESARPECNPLRLQNYVRALSQSLTAVQPATEVADCWHEFMSQQLGSILASEYSRTANLLRQHGVQPARYGADGDTRSQCLLTLRLLQELASDLRWIDDSRCTVPQSLTDSMLASWPETEPAAMAPMQDLGLEPGWTSYSGNALQTSQQPWVPSVLGGLRPVQPSQAPSALIQMRTLHRMMSHMTSDGRLLPPVQRILLRLEPVLSQLVSQDAAFFEDRLHPARQLLDELTARSLWFASESALGFAHFITVAEVAANQLAGAGPANAHVFAQVLQFVREQWPPEGRMSHIAALGRQAEAEHSTLPGLMNSTLGLLDGQIVGSIERIKPDTLQLAQMIRGLPSAKGVPEDILDFVTGPWACVIAQAQQRAEPGQERDPGGYLALVPSLLWSVSPLAAQDVTRLVELAPKLQRRLARGLRSVGRTDVEIAALAARLGSLQQRALDAAEAANRTGPTDLVRAGVSGESPGVLAGQERAAETVPTRLDITLPVLTDRVEDVPAVTVAQETQTRAAYDSSRPVFRTTPQKTVGAAVLESEAVASSPMPAQAVIGQGRPEEAVEWPLGTWVELCNERQQLRTKLTWVSPQQSLFLFTAEDGSTQSMTRRMRDKLLIQGQLRRLEAIA
ncbi:DUF1631 domain-containing protein [Comamonas sp. Tr-654]|uniref:DUF1631 family protein n=1 Tax=Comamonas sp. Tr-654 TaxID=2608341 RepID=UPI00141E772C|nr:DUF1631 family protein [Comamonas sp. Tr-654]NIF85442.1 DUF1631 domain-containing protein [Comamonas sp. Tr-654]